VEKEPIPGNFLPATRLLRMVTFAMNEAFHNLYGAGAKDATFTFYQFTIHAAIAFCS
jgi:hypothetical protein